MPKVCSCEGCNYPVFSKGLCKKHWAIEYGKPIKKVSDKRKATPPAPKQRKRINPRSKKKIAEDAEYKKIRDEWLKHNRKCVVCDMLGISGCTKVATEPHHTQGHGIFYLDTKTWLPTCRNGHMYELSNSEEAYLNGVTETRIVPVEQIINFKLGITDNGT